MDRRESLKLLLLAAAGGEVLLAPETLSGHTDSRVASSLGALRARFDSRWREWPDVRWAGPEYWGNRLQDWSIRGGALVCGVRGENRTLHCLTHRSTAANFQTAVSLDPSGLVGTGEGSVVGFRVGVTGRNPDYRSAAVHGTGVDAGINGTGHLVLGERRSPSPIAVDAPLRLALAVVASGSSARGTLTATAAESGQEVARVEAELIAADLIGNLALLAHFGDEGATPSEVQGATFADWTIDGSGIAGDEEAAFGPVAFASYTVHRGTLKLTAQLAPLELVPELAVDLLFGGPAGWRLGQSVGVDPLSRTAHFRVEPWNPQQAVPYRVRVRIALGNETADYTYDGTIAAEPRPGSQLKAAVFSCNADHGFPDGEVVEHVSKHEPDVALFLGDQFYEGSGGFGIQTDSVESAALDMLHKWYMFGWSYRELFRHVPAAFIPDDHDVYHGNVWGENGKAAPIDQGFGAVAQDQGGYKMPPEWINAVQRAQTSHLPDPFDPTPVEQGIGVYYTNWEYGGVSFAILEDRKFKSAPGNVLPEDAQVLNGWIQNPDFDVREHRDLPEASLLGDRQMRFLRAWAEDWGGGSRMKVVLSQTNFAAVHTIPIEATSGAVLPSLPMPALGVYVEGDKLAVDMDSNGWPQARRDEVLRLLQQCSAFHIAGDQHLATVVRHGIDAFGDAGFSFTGPALNNIWPRRWWPPREARQAPLEGRAEYAGDFFDGFGNRVTVWAAANPRATGLEPAIIRDRVTGYGLVTFDTESGRITMECWPRHVDPTVHPSGQYEGWPVVARREDGDGRSPLGYLPTIEVSGLDDAVVLVYRHDGSLVSATRSWGPTHRAAVFERVVHRVRVGDPDRGVWAEREVAPDSWGRGVLDFRF